MTLSYETVGVIVTIIFVVVFLTVAIRGGEKIMAERTAKLQNTKPAQATILSYEEKGGGRDNKGRFSSIVPRLQVKSAAGADYEVTTFWKVYPMATPNLQVGKTVAVKVDASNPQMVFPDLPSVEYDWMQAQIGK